MELERARGSVTRRAFVRGAGLAGLGLVAGCGGLPWQAQQSSKMPRVGVLLSVPAYPVGAPSAPATLRAALQELGYVERQNIVFDVGSAEGHADRVPDLAADLIQAAPDVIVTPSFPNTRAFAEANPAVPIVAVAMGDPVRSGQAASLARPGGNLTGIGVFLSQLAAKRLELLKEAVPAITRVGAVTSSSAPGLGVAEAAAGRLGVQLEPLAIGGPEDLERAFSEAAERGVEALLVLEGITIVAYQAQIAALAAAKRLPAIADRRSFVEAGGLLSYGPDLVDAWRRAATYVDKILKGAHAGDLPIEQATRFDFVINRKTADALGLAIPQHVLLQATEVIQ